MAATTLPPARTHDAHVQTRTRGRRTYVRLKGGLGNQLFQFAAATNVRGVGAVRAIHPRTTAQLDLASTVTDLVVPWSRLDRIRLGEVLDSATGWRRLARVALTPVRRSVARRTATSGSALAQAFESPEEFCPQPLVLDGYFQHPDWFSSVESDLLDRLVEAAPAEWAPDSTPVLHVRAGDYVHLGWNLEQSYYQRALAHLGEPSRLRIVTDDPRAGSQIAAMCAREGWEVASMPVLSNALDDFWCLAGAQRLVMSNSSFCWWAARLGDHRWEGTSPNRVVVAPEQWVLGHGQVLLHQTWLRA